MMFTTLVQLLSCAGFIAGIGAAAYGFGSLAVTACAYLAPTPTAAPVPLPRPAQPRALGPAPKVTYEAPHPSARCPVCRTGIQGEVRMCPSCRVLSHEDCWTFQGGCAIFGCCAKASA